MTHQIKHTRVSKRGKSFSAGKKRQIVRRERIIPEIIKKNPSIITLNPMPIEKKMFNMLLQTALEDPDGNDFLSMVANRALEDWNYLHRIDGDELKFKLTLPQESFHQQLEGIISHQLPLYDKEINESEYLTRSFSEIVDDFIEGKEHPPQYPKKHIINSEEEEDKRRENNIIEMQQKANYRMSTEYRLLTLRIYLYDKFLNIPRLKEWYDLIGHIRDHLFQLRTRIEVARGSYDEMFKKFYDFLEYDRK